jgi:hypothetical protein
MTETVTVVERPTGEAWDQWQGPWDSTVAYDKLDVVEHNGGSYIADEPTNAGDEPGVSSKWDLLAAAGDKPAAGIYQSSAQTLATNTNTIIEFDAVDFDTDSLADLTNNRILVNKDGIWLVVSSVSYNEEGVLDGSYRFNRVQHNNSHINKIGIPPTDAWTSVLLQRLVDASDGDVIKIEGRHNAGEDRNTEVSDDISFLQATYIGQVF